jgi:energy-converting hydrogenase Eha subunit E
LFILVVLGTLAWGVQSIWHPLDPYIKYVNQDIGAVGATLSSQMVAGVSLASLVLFLIFMLIPLAIRGVHNGQFLGSFIRGVLSSAVFLVSDWIYGLLEHWGRFWLLVGIALMIVVTLVLIELITRAGREQDEVSTRTDLMASITSGLAFSLLLNMGTYAWSSVQAVLLK